MVAKSLVVWSCATLLLTYGCYPKVAVVEKPLTKISSASARIPVSFTLEECLAALDQLRKAGTFQEAIVIAQLGKRGLEICIQKATVRNIRFVNGQIMQAQVAEQSRSTYDLNQVIKSIESFRAYSEAMYRGKTFKLSKCSVSPVPVGLSPTMKNCMLLIITELEEHKEVETWFKVSPSGVVVQVAGDQ